MTDLTLRETVALALFSTTCYEPWSVSDRANIDHATTAALTALADHPGLVEVLRRHIPCTWTGVTTPDGLPMMTCGRGLPAGPDRLSAHLADVIRAWLRP